MDRRRQTGQLGETAAAKYLSEHGVTILERNFRCRFGEIDLIGAQDGTLLIIEVKTRRNGSGAESVDQRKQKRICTAFTWYRMKQCIPDNIPVRFDVIEVDAALSCRWIRNAFEYYETFM